MSGRRLNKKKPVGRKQRIPRSVVMRPSLGPSDELFKVRTCFYYANAGATASISTAIPINSLLTSGYYSLVGQPTMLANVAKNYAAYRVERFTLEYDVFSRHTANVLLIVFPLSEDPGYASGSSVQTLAGAFPGAQSHLVPANTTSPCNLYGHKMGHTIQSIVGSPEIHVDDGYAGTTNTSGVFTDPSKPVYLVFHQGLAAGGTFTAGQSAAIKGVITQWVRFYDKRY